MTHTERAALISDLRHMHTAVVDAERNVQILTEQLEQAKKRSAFLQVDYEAALAKVKQAIPVEDTPKTVEESR